ncbi:MAG: thiosulfate sulfurtransferase [Alphaproteobacteria bacterium]|nr:thiosulfate sulfurtransferase [Alphaproteobacteria bacterium]
MRRIDVPTLRRWILDGEELAILDAREEGEFASGHLFWAVPVPLSRREIRARALLPRLSVRIVCVDDGRGLAERLAEYLAGIGATDLAVLEGGTPAWAAAGFELFSGVNVPSKAFGEWVEHHYGTPSIDAAELRAWLDQKRNVRVLDSRPLEEFRAMSIPAAIDVPGGELVYRIGDLAPDPETVVVVNCAGRTRSILGAESLRRAGIPNPVVALRNGTMGWQLAGFAVERGRDDRFPAGTPATLELARRRAAAFAEASGVGVIGPLDLARFEEDPDRTVYVLDVRDPDEFHAGHRPLSRNAPGGQLVQATDQWIAVRNARIALVDDTGVRARMAAAWLRQMGYRDVFVVEGGLDEARKPGAAPIAVPELDRPVDWIDPDALAARLADAEGSRPLVLDLGRSLDFRTGHVPGAVWGIRTRLEALRARLEPAREAVVTSPGAVLARLALPELGALTAAPIRVLQGGTDAWRQAGFPLQASPADPPDAACLDAWLRPYDRVSGAEQAMRDYLAWEVALPDQIARDGTVAFGVPGTDAAD